MAASAADSTWSGSVGRLMSCRPMLALIRCVLPVS
jgi:hypothetical protein